VLETGSARDHHVRLGRDARHERVDHGGLADARFSAEEHELPLATSRALEPRIERVQQARTPDRFGRGIFPRHGSGGPAAWCDEAIPAARHRLDEARSARVVTQRPADLQDAHLDHTVGDVGIRPAGSEELRLRDELASPLDQAAQDREGFRGERHLLAVAHEPFVGEVQREALEREVSICVHRHADEPLPHRFLTVT
jgi:hypothetical protein